jgi:hypothetical protein
MRQMHGKTFIAGAYFQAALSNRLQFERITPFASFWGLTFMSEDCALPRLPCDHGQRVLNSLIAMLNEDHEFRNSENLNEHQSTETRFRVTDGSTGFSLIGSIWHVTAGTMCKQVTNFRHAPPTILRPAQSERLLDSIIHGHDIDIRWTASDARWSVRDPFQIDAIANTLPLARDLGEEVRSWG